MNKFNKGDRVIVIHEEFKDKFPSIYKVNKVYLTTNGTYLYTLLDIKTKRILKTEHGYVAQEEWLDLVAK